jgi:hypothetical protein
MGHKGSKEKRLDADKKKCTCAGFTHPPTPLSTERAAAALVCAGGGTGRQLTTPLLPSTCGCGGGWSTDGSVSSSMVKKLQDETHCAPPVCILVNKKIIFYIINNNI